MIILPSLIPPPPIVFAPLSPSISPAISHHSFNIGVNLFNSISALTLKKIKVLFNQLFDYALKNDICNKDYSSFVDIVQYKDRNPNKYDRNKFEKNEIDIIWK